MQCLEDRVAMFCCVRRRELPCHAVYGEASYHVMLCMEKRVTMSCWQVKQAGPVSPSKFGKHTCALLQSNPDVQDWMKANSFGTLSQLESYFESRVLDLATLAGRSYIVWQVIHSDWHLPILLVFPRSPRAMAKKL